MTATPNAPCQDRPSFTGMEDTLRDACERAMQLVFPLLTMLRLYRSVIGLTRALMHARKDAGLPPGLSDELVALLEKVRDTTGLHFPDPDLPIEDAIRLHVAMMKLAAIAHRAKATRLIPPKAQRSAAAQPLSTTEPAPEPVTPTERAGMQRDEAQDPMHRENAALAIAAQSRLNSAEVPDPDAPRRTIHPTAHATAATWTRVQRGETKNLIHRENPAPRLARQSLLSSAAALGL